MLKTAPKNLLKCSLTSCDFSQSSCSFVLQEFLDKAIKSEIAAALKTSDNTNARRFPLERVDHLESKCSRSCLVFSVISKIVNQVLCQQCEVSYNEKQSQLYSFSIWSTTLLTLPLFINGWFGSMSRFRLVALDKVNLINLGTRNITSRYRGNLVYASLGKYELLNNTILHLWHPTSSQVKRTPQDYI